MLHDVPPDVRRLVTALLSERSNIELIDFSYHAGGCINNGGKLTTSSGDYFLKWNSSTTYPAMFEAEAKGLKLLRRPEVIFIPEVIGHGESDSHQFLLIEYIHQAPRSRLYWRDLGIQLAALHGHSHTEYGLDHNNYIGSLPQSNRQHKSWIDFFVEERVNFQLRLAVECGRASQSWVQRFDKLYSKLPSLMPAELPALLHGDLWGGNLITSSNGDPALIDPAVYYGHREADLSMTRLFGGFDPEFYRSYENALPLAPGFEDRVGLYNLYPLLVHLNLFGSAYESSILTVLRRFI